MTAFAPTDAPRAVLALHGGAGTIRRDRLSAEREARYRAALAAILADGERQLARGDAALDVAIEAVRRLEEEELFNAGKGAVYTADERHELDASVMDGRDRAAGAVAGVTRVRNPVLAARAVMTHSGHVMLIGPAADAFAFEQGLERVEPGWFGTPQRLLQLKTARAQALGQVLDHDGQRVAEAAQAEDAATASGPIDERDKFGTVGAVVRDLAGHLAAATSTGGMTNKRPGRVGDSPIPGAGCFADDRSVAVSCTGTGEAFIRASAAHEVGALMRIGGLGLDAACARVVFDELPMVGGDGGLIAVDRAGNVWLGFNTEGMYRGWVAAGGAPVVGIYRDA
ncbi:isoaspartyl peptidase/L-asparaginase [Mitsuaria sp. GD03876]|uniref:isoaspartyl peptidase/L-asparaginase family protein n=1 Tax=Mitsuaria sp. GD03876 TaxID=2975399 RepID=UPI00244BBF80|nr:isoaspartyl peptidase/L-asparaginase [Mitsuaria sp. GD03876]MDH0866786.1 isoaspartyl peptidase/L-asparaginase [Mitsuaria sp. GD03876]